MELNVNRLKKWSQNTRYHHTRRGITINATPTEIFQKALKTIIDNKGCCPNCGEQFTQTHHHPHQLTLENLGSGDYEVICFTCNQRRDIGKQRVENLNRFCNLDGTRWTGGK